MPRDRIGLVTFSTEPALRIHLTNDSDMAKSIIDSLSAGGYTNIGGGISTATAEFNLNGRVDDAIWVMILLSDGLANRPLYNGRENLTYAKEYALEKAKEAYEAGAEQNLRIYTIGLGAKTDIDENLLEQIAEGPLEGISGTLEGKYFYAPSSNDLEDIYTRIAQDLTFKVEYDMILLDLTIKKPR